MSSFTLIAITTENYRCLGQIPTGSAAPNPQCKWQRKSFIYLWEDFQRHATLAQLAGTRAPEALAFWEHSWLWQHWDKEPCPCTILLLLGTARRFQTPPDSVFECFQPAFLTSNLWKKNTIWHLAPENLPISASHSIIHKAKNWTAHVMYQANAISLFAQTLAPK